MSINDIPTPSMRQFHKIADQRIPPDATVNPAFVRILKIPVSDGGVLSAPKPAKPRLIGQRHIDGAVSREGNRRKSIADAEAGEDIVPL